MHVLLLAMLAAAPGRQSELDRAVAAFDALDFVAARRAIDRARHGPALSHEDQVRLAIYSGLVFAYTGDPDSAKADFRSALALDPVAQLPPGLSPKVVALFGEARRGATSSTTTRLAVMNFEESGASPQAALAASGAVAHEIEQIGVFQVVTPDNLKALLSLERQKQLLGCSEGQSQCFTELAGALGVDYLVSGRVNGLPGKPGEPPSFTLELSLLDVQKARRVSSAITTAASERDIVLDAAATAGKLLAPLLAGHKGYVELDCPERGAEVKVDGTLIGTTPLAAALPLPAGTHRLDVTKEGFVTFSTDVRIQANQKASVVASLEPSLEFIERYHAHESKLRAGAWIATGLAVAGAGAAAYFGWQSEHLYGSASTPGTFQFDKAMLASGVESDSNGDYRSGATSLKARIQSANTGGYVCGGVAAAAAVAAVTFWIVGEDPGRYANRPQVSMVPVQSGAAAVLGGTF